MARQVLTSPMAGTGKIALPLAVHTVLSSPGRPLDAATRSAMRAQFAHVAHARAPMRSPLPGILDTVLLSAHDAATEIEADALAQRVGMPARHDVWSLCDGPDFAQVIVHTDALAAQATRSLGTHAFSYGQHVVIDGSRYAPGTMSGMRLLAHELVHTLQSSWSGQYALMRDTHGSTDGSAQPESHASMSVTMDGLHFQFPGAVLGDGPPRLQVMVLVLKRLVGDQYKPGLEQQVFDALDKTNSQGIGYLNASSAPAPGKTVPDVNLDLGATVTVLRILNDLHVRNVLNDAQFDILMSGAAALSAWDVLKRDFPAWYTLWIFRRQLAQQGEALEAWKSAWRNQSQDANDARTMALNAIEAVLIDRALVAESIRTDLALANEATKPTDDMLLRRDRESAAVAYALLFKVELSPDPSVTHAPETVVEEKMAQLLGYMQTQQNLTDAAGSEGQKAHDARTQLMARFGRFYVRSTSGSGDEQILKHPARANAPAWDGKLTDSPASTPPMFEAALETDHTFTMHLQWAHWTDAMASYSYRWDFIRIDDTMLGKPGEDVLQAAGDKPSGLNVLSTRLKRARRYNATDLERVNQQLGGTAWGDSARDLVHVGNAMRIAGTLVHYFFDRLTRPDYSTQYVFPGPGLYVVRCSAVPILDGDEEIKRLPTVSVVPVTARDPDERAIAEVKDIKHSQFLTHLRIAEIQSLLASPFPPENAEALREELKDLQASTLAPTEALKQRGETLDAQIATLEKRLDLHKRINDILAQPESQRDKTRLAELQKALVQAGGEYGNAWDEEREIRTLREQRSSNQDTIDMENERTRDEKGTRFSPIANFVSDTGQSMQLSLEMFDRGKENGTYQVFISDLTTPDSGQALGESPQSGSAPEATPKVADPRVQAIRNGLKILLETSSDYGRGRVAIDIDGTVYFVRIDAGTGRMLSEAADNAATVASLAAIAFAPITEGASLFFLLPIGAAGAVTSAYRLYQRYDEKRLRMDFAAAMEVVNIVGGVLGLAEVATPLRAVRLGKVLMVMGMGINGAGIVMMGAGIMIQLDALQSLPEEERAARMLEILGQAMLQVGIQVGAAVAHAHYESTRGVTAGGEQEAQAPEPGFHAGSPEELTNPPAHASDPGERSMAGSGKPTDNTPRSSRETGGTTTPAARPASSPEHLFDRLQQGVDRSLPPPRTGGEAASEPASGPYKTGLTTADAAYAAYNKALAAAGGREVAIFHNPKTGEFCVMIGSKTGVNAPDIGWNALLHYHPNEGNALTFRLPAPQDFKGLMHRYFAEQGVVREFIEFDIPGVGRGRTEYGIDPGSPEPFYVRINEADGSSRTMRFANDGHYSAYWGERKIAVPEGSPVYDAMIRDIQDYIRSIRGNQTERFGPHEQTQAGTTANDPAQADGKETPTGGADKTMAKANTSKVTEPLQSGNGELTDEGVAYIRSRFKSVSEGKGKSTLLSELSGPQIKERFPNQPAWLEAIVVAQARSDWLGKSTPTDFVMSNPKQNFRDVATKLDTALSSGATGHSLHTAILDWNVTDFVDEMLRQGDPSLTAAFNACENSPDPVIHARWREFRTSTKAGDMSGFFLGRVGSKQPDLVEVLLSQNEIHITDATFAYGDPIHNFKSAFYKAVMERLINVGTVTATDYRSPLRQSPIGP